MLYHLETMTEQEVFDAVCNHLLTQNKQSSIYSCQCRYHGPDGLKCAAGIFIDDDQYTLSMEGKTWDNLVEKNLVPSEHHMLISQMQKIHDQQDPDQWKMALSDYASNNDLEMNYGI